MILKSQRPHRSLAPLPATSLPQLTIITGINGVGKTHLLEAIHNGAVLIDDHHEGGGRIGIFSPYNISPAREDEFHPNDVRRDDKFTFEALTDFLQINRMPQRIHDIVTPAIPNFNAELHLSILCNASALDLSEKFSLSPDEASEIRNSVDHTIAFLCSGFQASLSSDQNNLLRRIEKNSGKKYISLSKQEFIDSIDPDWGTVDIFQNAFSKLFVTWTKLYERNIVLNHAYNNQLRDEPGLNDIEFEEKYGPKPWILVNKVLAAAGLPFMVDNPLVGSEDPYRPHLKKTGSNSNIEFSGLSSGERVLMSFAFTVYYASDKRHEIARPKILLLDEIDASLHPSMCRGLLKTIDEVLVKEFGMSVIMTTHSPSTVALAPEESLHVMRPGQPGIHKVGRDAALRDLTSGVPTLSINMKDRVTVFVESPKDAVPYSHAYNIVKNKISSDFMPVFIGTGTKSSSGSDINTGCENVIRITNDLTMSGAQNIIGLLDWDGHREPSGRIFILAKGKRNGIESVFFDPLLLFDLLASERIISVTKYQWPIDRSYASMNLMTTEQLQSAVDAVQVHVLGRGIEDTVDVDYFGGFKLKLDKYYLLMDDHSLEERVINIHQKIMHLHKQKKLLPHIAEHIMADCPGHIPLCLIDTFKDLVSA